MKKNIDKKKKLSTDTINVCEYLEYIRNPKKVLWVNFIRGTASGLGMAVGFTILGALLIYFLKSVVKLNLPLIGKLIADIVKIVQDNIR